MDLRAGDKLLWCIFHMTTVASIFHHLAKTSVHFLYLQSRNVGSLIQIQQIEVNGILIGSWTLHAYWYFLSQRASKEFPKYLSKAYQYFLFHYLQLADPLCFYRWPGFIPKKYAKNEIKSMLFSFSGWSIGHSVLLFPCPFYVQDSI